MFYYNTFFGKETRLRDCFLWPKIESGLMRHKPDGSMTRETHGDCGHRQPLIRGWNVAVMNSLDCKIDYDSQSYYGNLKCRVQFGYDIVKHTVIVATETRVNAILETQTAPSGMYFSILVASGHLGFRDGAPGWRTSIS